MTFIKETYGFMPSNAAANSAIPQVYINGLFCYALRFGIVINGLGIVRDITFYTKDFPKIHPDIVIEKKSFADSKALIPVLKDFFQKHPLINTKTFLGGSTFIPK